MLMVMSAAIAFVGTHFLLSHPLRAPLVARVGEKGFLGLYSLVAFATLGWLVMAYRSASVTEMLWPVGDGLWALATIIMLVASVLLMGSLVGNPAMPDPDGAVRVPAQAKGVFAVTRHPMLWSFALWGICHILVYPVAKNIIVALAILILSLVGAALQDRKKERLQPAQWREWEAKTSYWPFAAIVAGRARFGRFGAHALAGGVVVWLAATWAHMPLAGWAAGIWRWIG
ncbi:NnrU family protein [Sphingobium soli]|uniref:NnrU family protein n=1 Tax=Sphingobium soli TaxID=1591116 RepID=A0ABS8H0E8_9SPHN|nr:NnrU family protein [Sphingobium soli]MCC4231593.1 NnrU family protein [Sphingobium soli]